MTVALHLNEAPSHLWAGALSGTAWKAWKLELDEGLEAEGLRGPRAVWVWTFGENKLLTPDGSPLFAFEVQGPNTAWYCECFKGAARYRVRHSVRWRPGKRQRAARKRDARDTSRLYADPTAKERREVRRAWKEKRWGDRLRALAPASWHKDPDGIDKDLTSQWDGWGRGLIRKYRPRAERPGEQARSPLRQAPEREVLPNAEMAAYFSLTGQSDALAALLAHWRTRRPTIGELLKDLERAAYRAYLARRVKPVSRRTRIRRPLYARPRPPNAPLAPPVI